MKGLLICFLLAISFNLYCDEADFAKDGALLWSENCMGCHIPQNFIAAVPEEDYVTELVEEIEFNIYDPESGMSVLDYLKSFELQKIARFLIYGRHQDTWITEGLHGQMAKEFGTDNCYNCHDNRNFYKEPPVSCNQCH